MTPLLVIVGPTAAGKTALALEIAQRWRAEIVGADASQIYRGMDIGTGKATGAERGTVPHHLLDVVDPDAHFDANSYVERADEAIAAIRARGHRVIVCGGTGLYIRALLHGLCEAPPLSDEVREAIRTRVRAGEVEALHAELAEVDPDAAARIAPRDKQRIERALGVFRTTGRPLSAWQAEHRFQEDRYPARFLGIDRSRAALDARIEARTRAMFARGFVDEVRALVQAGYGASLRSMAALGYRFVARHLDGELSLEEAIEQTVVATRRYARRQRTWFRRVDGVRWIEPDEPSEAIDAWIAEFWTESSTMGEGSES